MNKIIAKISLICWGIVSSFFIFFLVIGLVPENSIWVVSAVLGAVILAVLGFVFYRTTKKEGFDFGWFLVFRKGFWQIILALAGIFLFLFGILGVFSPGLADSLAEKHIMTIAKMLVILFWVALTSTFLGWELICLSESVGYWRLGERKSAIGSFALGLLWLLFALLFLYLFLEVINDVFVNVSVTAQNWVLGIFAGLSIVAGLVSGRFEKLKNN